MNIGYEEEELKPFEEAMADLTDQKRIGNDFALNGNIELMTASESSALNWLKIDIYLQNVWLRSAISVTISKHRFHKQDMTTFMRLIY